jgi:uncharacterized protein DUF2442
MNESKAIRIADVKYKGDYTLRLRWANDKALTVDLREPVFRLKGMRPLRDTAAFALAGVGEGGHSVVWPGEIDMGAARLLELALEQNGRADAVEFIRWRWKQLPGRPVKATRLRDSATLARSFSAGTPCNGGPIRAS